MYTYILFLLKLVRVGL